MNAILDQILSDENHGTTLDGKKISLLMKFGQPLTGSLAGTDVHGIYKIKALMQEGNKAPTMMWVYFAGEDVAMILAPDDSRITIASTTDISSFRGK